MSRIVYWTYIVVIALISYMVGWSRFEELPITVVGIVLAGYAAGILWRYIVGKI